MKTVEVVIRIPEEEYHYIQLYGSIKPFSGNFIAKQIKNGTVLPKGHGRLIDERDIVNGNYEVIGNRIYELEPIIEADTESEDKG